MGGPDRRKELQSGERGHEPPALPAQEAAQNQEPGLLHLLPVGWKESIASAAL